MKRNLIKAMLVILVACLLVAIVAPTVSFGLTYSEINESSVVKDAEDKSGAAKSVQNIIGGVLTVVQVVGSGIAVIMLIVLAIKYISASDKAEIKKHAVVYVVGAVVLFAATGIIGIVRNFASQNIVSSEDA